MEKDKRGLFNRSARTPIPWVSKQSDLFGSWNWETEHFLFTILGAGTGGTRMFQWKVFDKTTGEKVMFDEGEAVSFTDAVDSALEIIAKGYPRSYGYSTYAGGLANTFTISDGSRADFSEVLGREVVLVAKGNDGLPMQILGGFEVSHYDVLIIRNGKSTVVPPNRIVDVLVNSGATSIIDELIV